MSHSAVLQLFLNKPITIDEVVNILFDTGWLLNDHGRISLYIKTADDEHDWIDMKLVEEKDFFAILKTQGRYENLAGLVLSWRNSIEGISVLIQNSKLLTISMQINRKTLDNSIFTDTNWYLERILVPLSRDLQIESFIWNEHL